MQGRWFERARNCVRLPSIGGAVLAAVLALAPPRTAAAAPAGALSMNPSNNAVAVGETVTLTLDITGAVDVHEVHIAVGYNTSVLQAVDYDAGASGVQVLPGPFPGTDTEGAILQNAVSGGIINYQFELDGSAEVSGSGTIATVQFTVLAQGSGDLAWSVRQLRDGNGVSLTPSGAAAVVVVGNAPPPPTSTLAPPTSTPVATNTPGNAPTSTHTVTAPTPVSTVPVASVTRTIQSTPTPVVTATPRPAGTPRVVVIENSNSGNPPASGVDPSQSDRANGLPQAGTEGPSIEWWKWTFFVAALMLGVAGWFFTYAVHHNNREVILMDRFDERRRKYGRRLPRR